MRKKQKTMEELLEEALVPEEEQPYEVPGNWVWVKSGYIAKWGSGGTPSRKKEEYYKGNIPWIKTGELRDNVILDSEEKISEEALKKSSAKLFPKDSVAIAMYGATIGKLGILGIDAATNQACAVGVPHFLMDKDFMFYYFFYQRKTLIDLGKGGAQPNISQTIIKDFPHLLPPLKEQKRIVNKIKQLLSKIDEAKRLIEEAKETFELRRAAILDKAFRGEMMEKSHISRESNANLYEIPINWKWKTFGDVAQVCSNLVDPKQYLELPHIAPDNIEKGTGQLLEYQTIEESKVKSPKHYFKKGQILYSKIRPYLSKVIIAEFEGLCSADMYPIETDLDAKYLFWYMLSPFFVEKASTAGSRSVLPKINKKELGNIPIPVPPKETQKKIVRIIESALSREKQTIGYLESIVGLMEKLKQSILSKAFRGELGTNDPTEESAIELLKEVLQEQVK